MFSPKPSVIPFLAALVLLPSVYATPELRLSDGVNSVDVLDGSLADSCPVANCVTFIGSVGKWSLNVTTGEDGAASAPAIMHLSSVDTAIASAGTLTIEFSADGFTQTDPEFLFTASVFATQGSFSGTFSAYGDSGNTKFATTSQIGSTLNFSGSGTQTVTGANNLSVPYSLTEIATLSFNNSPGNASFDAALEGVPEPGSITLFLTVLAGSAWIMRRKKNLG